MFIAALSIIAKLWRGPKCPSTDEWIKKRWCVCVCVSVSVCVCVMEYYLAIKKNGILPFATTWMEPEGIMLSEVSQSDKDNYMVSLVCGIKETKQMNIGEGKEK